MATDWISTIVVVIIVVVGLLILYRALKEPLDMLFGFVGRSLGKIKDGIVDSKESGSSYYEEIRYG